MFFPSRAFAQQNNPPQNTSRYRSHLISNYPSGLENQPPQNFYSRNYDYNYKTEQPYIGTTYYRSRVATEQSSSKYYGSDRPSYNASSVSKYYPSAVYHNNSNNNNSNNRNQTPVYQYKSRYDCYDETSLENRYGIRITNERTYYQPSYQYQNRAQLNSQYQNNQEFPTYINPSKYKNRQESNYYDSSPRKNEVKKRRRAESVNTHANYNSCMYNYEQPRNCDYISSNIKQDQPQVDFSYIAHKYGNFQKKEEQSKFQRKYPLILTNDEPLFKTAQSPNHSNDSSDESDSSQSSSSPEIKTSKSHKKEEMRPFDPNRQLFSKAQNEVFQQYADQRINEIRAARGQPPYQPPTQQKQTPPSQQSHQIPSRQEPNYYLPSYEHKQQYENQITKNKSKSKRNASVQQKRQPEVKFAFKSNEQEPVYTSPRVNTSNNYVPDNHDDLIRKSSQSQLSPTSRKYAYTEQYDHRQQQQPDKHHEKKHKQKKSKHDIESPQKQQKNTYSKKNHISSDSDDKEDSADIVSRLAKFRKTIEESKKTERQLGELLGCNETPRAQSSTDDTNNNFLSETDSLQSAKANQNEFLSEPSLIFEGQ